MIPAAPRYSHHRAALALPFVSRRLLQVDNADSDHTVFRIVITMERKGITTIFRMVIPIM